MGKEVAVIGAGWYGIHTARKLAERGYKVTLIEKNDDICKGISGTFGIRDHCGAHYPRSRQTRESCYEGATQFAQEYPEVIVDMAYSIYGSASELDACGEPSKISHEEFRKVLLNEISQHSTVEEVNPKSYGLKGLHTAYNVNEPTLAVGERLRDALRARLKKANIDPIFNFNVKDISRVDGKYHITNSKDERLGPFDHVVNSTSYKELLDPILLKSKSIRPANMKVTYQPCLSVVYEDTQSHYQDKPFGVIVMDGWYPCIMPVNDRILAPGDHQRYILTHGKWTILGSYNTPEEAERTLEETKQNGFINNKVIPECEKEVSRFYPGFNERFKFLKVDGVVLAKPITETELRCALTFQVKPQQEDKSNNFDLSSNDEDSDPYNDDDTSDDNDSVLTIDSQTTSTASSPNSSSSHAHSNNHYLNHDSSHTFDAKKNPGGIIHIVPGKITNISEAADEVIDLIEHTNVTTSGAYNFTENGALRRSMAEFELKIQTRNTCKLQTYEDEKAKVAGKSPSIPCTPRPSPRVSDNKYIDVGNESPKSASCFDSSANFFRMCSQKVGEFGAFKASPAHSLNEAAYSKTDVHKRERSTSLPTTDRGNDRLFKK